MTLDLDAIRNKLAEHEGATLIGDAWVARMACLGEFVPQLVAEVERLRQAAEQGARDLEVMLRARYMLTREYIDLAEGVREGRVDPALLRWCDWPGCWRSYDATTGPVGEPGWMAHRRPMVLLCPDHDPVGHRPGFEWTDGQDHIVGSCECGASADLQPTNHRAVIDWWTAHVTAVAS